jgi:SsrA-binding protein
MKTKHPSIITNRRARYDYTLGQELTVGLILTGPEVRAIRDRRVHLKGTFVTIKDNQLFLNNLTLSTTSARPIKLLATRRQITLLAREKLSGLTIIPTKLIPTSHFIKLVIALARGKKKYDKRETIKLRDLSRENHTHPN